MTTRHLHLARHGEPTEHGDLSGRGVRQADLLGRRLSAVPFTSISHGPAPRARQTAQVVAGHLTTTAEPATLDAAGDYVPHVPRPDDLDPAHRPGAAAFLGGLSDDETARGARLAVEAIDLLTGAVARQDDTHHLVITHAFIVGWIVGHAMSAPPWRWLGLDSCHAALTVIRYTTDRPPALLVFNDMAHLPDELRWTGFDPRPAV